MHLWQALQEPSFSVTYANLCHVMRSISVECVAESTPGMPKTSTNFLRILLDTCEQEFVKDLRENERLSQDIARAGSVSYLAGARRGVALYPGAWTVLLKF